MKIQKFYELERGTKVGVIKTGGYYGHVSQHGIYTVTKCNGAVCEITRDSDGHVRTFSNRTGCEKRSYGGSDSRYNTAQLISVDRYQTMVDQRLAEKLRAELWASAVEAANTKNLRALRDLIGQLEANGVV